MSYQERKAILNIISSIAILGSYSYYTFIITAEVNQPLINDLAFWAKFILISIPVAIVAKIFIHIAFVILNAIATREKDIEIEDERDQLIELKSQQISNYFFGAGLIVSISCLLFDVPQYYMFITMIIAGLLSEIIGELSKFVYHRKGI